MAEIKQAKFIDQTGQEKDAVFIGAEKAIYDDSGKRLDQKLEERKKATGLLATDTQGILGGAGTEVSLQAIIDKVAEKITNELVSNSSLAQTLANYVTKAMMSNVQVNDQNKVPTSALAYAMQQAIAANATGVTQLNNNIGNTGKYLRTDNIDNAAETLWPKIEESSSYDFTWIPENAGGITAGAKARVIGSYINSKYETQMVLSYLSSAPVVQREKINGSWGEWKAFVIKSDLEVGLLNTTDLNTLKITGNYLQNMNDNATIDRHYPVGSKAGFLEVIGYGKIWVLQRYTIANATMSYTRIFYLEKWTDWI